LRQLLPALQADQAVLLVQADDAVLNRLRNQMSDLMVAHPAFRALKAHLGTSAGHILSSERDPIRGSSKQGCRSGRGTGARFGSGFVVPKIRAMASAGRKLA
jgi:hypothetical protein